jgi:hypothetical protein
LKWGAACCGAKAAGGIEMQTMSVLAESSVHTIEMPAANQVLFGDVRWGEFDNVFTAAF